MIVLKKKMSNLYVTIIINILFFWVPMMFFIWLYFHANNRQHISISLFAALLLFAGGIYMIYDQISKTPTVELDDEKINFNNKKYYWTDLTSIDLWKTVGAGRGRLPATILTFNKKEIIYFFDSYYTNTNEAKNFLQQKIIDKKETIEESVFDDVNEELIKNDFYEVYKGNEFTSPVGIFLWMFLILLLYIIVLGWQKDSMFLIISFSCFSFLWFLLISYLANYAKLSKDYLIIKNTHFFWKNEVFKISNINEIIVIGNNKLIKIIIKDLNYKQVPLGYLKKNRFKDLENRLEEYGVKIQKQLYY